MTPITNPDHRLVAQKTYEFNVQAAFESARVQAEHGRWLLATVAAVHLGAIYFVGNLQGPLEAAKIASIWIFVVGLMLILFSGLATWANWSLFAQLYRKWSDANMLVDADKWPKSGHFAFAIPATYWLALVLGILSALCVPIGALVLTCAAR